MEAEPTAQTKGRIDEAATADGAEHLAQPEWVRWTNGPLPEPTHVGQVSTSCVMARLQTSLLHVHIDGYKLHGALPADEQLHVHRQPLSQDAASFLCTHDKINILHHLCV